MMHATKTPRYPSQNLHLIQLPPPPSTQITYHRIKILQKIKNKTNKNQNYAQKVNAQSEHNSVPNKYLCQVYFLQPCQILLNIQQAAFPNTKIKIIFSFAPVIVVNSKIISFNKNINGNSRRKKIVPKRPI
eukprot:TRINITY_DN3877_c0_g1_i2.p2 TRINITY_DN3877_c0_g1~~TRINITY_DN3877_c0_g1_i2.p2  ORF type:complete len:131 (+),score=6.00 TRINITY_DN3877_c0_g1_i2:65-457(+)